jgi:hypothetical protein
LQLGAKSGRVISVKRIEPSGCRNQEEPQVAEIIQLGFRSGFQVSRSRYKISAEIDG